MLNNHFRSIVLSRILRLPGVNNQNFAILITPEAVQISKNRNNCVPIAAANHVRERNLQWVGGLHHVKDFVLDILDIRVYINALYFTAGNLCQAMGKKYQKYLVF